MADYNDQDRFAHQDRPEDRRSPAAVLHRVCGKLFAPEQLQSIFYSARFGRVLDRAGDTRFRRRRVYAERVLRGEPVAVYAAHLTLVYRGEPLARYRATHEPDKRRLQKLAKEQLLRDPASLAAGAIVGVGRG